MRPCPAPFPAGWTNPCWKLCRRCRPVPKIKRTLAIADLRSFRMRVGRSAGMRAAALHQCTNCARILAPRGRRRLKKMGDADQRPGRRFFRPLRFNLKATGVMVIAEMARKMAEGFVDDSENDPGPSSAGDYYGREAGVPRWCRRGRRTDSGPGISQRHRANPERTDTSCFYRHPDGGSVLFARFRHRLFPKNERAKLLGGHQLWGALVKTTEHHCGI